MRHPGEKTARQMVIQTEETEFAKQRSENSQATVRKQRVIPNYYRRLSGGEQERQDWGYGQDLGRGGFVSPIQICGLPSTNNESHRDFKQGSDMITMVFSNDTSGYRVSSQPSGRVWNQGNHSLSTWEKE